jgi:hypothetical protein
MKLARCGKTIVVFNVSTVCDAFILQWNNITTVELPDLNEADLCRAAMTLKRLPVFSMSSGLCRP